MNNFLKTASKLTSIEENSELSSGRNNRINFHSIFFSYFFPFTGGSSSEPTMRPVPRVRGSVSSRSSMSTTPSLATSAGPGQQSSRSSARQSKTDLPSLDFLENEVGLWDAFFSNTRSGSKHSSVLQPDPLPFENYIHGAVARGEGRPQIQVFLGIFWSDLKAGILKLFWSHLETGTSDLRISPLSAFSSHRLRSTLYRRRKTILPQVWPS